MVDIPANNLQELMKSEPPFIVVAQTGRIEYVVRKGFEIVVRGYSPVQGRISVYLRSRILLGTY